MASGKSYSKGLFSPTLYWKNVKRFWPLWAAACLVWFLLIPGVIWSQNARSALDFDQLRRLTVNNVYAAVFLGGATGLAASLCVLRYMFVSRAAGFIHALPLRREGLWLTDWASGLTIALIPVVTTGLLTLLAETGLAAGYDWYGLGAFSAVLAASSLFGFALGALCCTVTGNLPTAVIFFVLANVLIWFVWYLFGTLLETLAPTLDYDYETTWLVWLTPIWKLLDDGSPVNPEGLLVVNDLWLYGVYSIVALVLGGVGGLLYRCRPTESAGDVIAAGWLRPLFRLALAVFAALALAAFGVETYDLDGTAANFLLITLLVAVGCCIGWFAAQMLMKKSFRVFTRPMALGYAGLTVLLLVGCLGVWLDPFGVQSKVPDVREVVRVEAQCGGTVWQADPAETCALHRALSQEKTTHISGSPIAFRYTLADGSSLTRRYTLPAPENEALFDQARDYVMAPQAVRDRVLGSGLDVSQVNRVVLWWPEGVEIYWPDGSSTTQIADAEAAQGLAEEQTIYGEDARAVAAALEEDLLAGRYGDMDWLFGAENQSDLWLQLELRVPRPDGGSTTYHADIDMTQDMSALKSVLQTLN